MGVSKHFARQGLFCKTPQGMPGKICNMRKSSYNTGRTSHHQRYYSLIANHLFYGLTMGHNKAHRSSGP